MPNGTVKFFNAAKGFGFITPEEGGKDVFFPAASVTASGISGLKAGQRVSFDAEPDSKGPKAVNLKLLADAPLPVPQPVSPPAPERPAPAVRMAPPSPFTVFLDAANDDSHAVVATLRAAGHEPLVIDYIATPPSKDELKTLSILLRGSDQSLVRRYDPLFQELYLDDRFIGDNEFWTAIFEHPRLINGPVLATAHKARICRSANAVREFLGLPEEAAAAPAARSKPVAAPVLALVKDTRTEETKNREAIKTPQPVQKSETVKKTSAPKKDEDRRAEKTPVKAVAAKKATPPSKASTKVAAKAPARKAAPKPVKKAPRGSKK